MGYKKNIILRNAIPTDKAKYDILQLLRIYQDVGATQLKNTCSTNLIIYWIKS